MKRVRKLIWVILALYLLPVPVFGRALASDGGLPFSDVKEEDWFCEAVSYVLEHGLMTGTDGGTFSPDAVTSRGMVVTILHRLEGGPATPEADFVDVPAGQWYTAGASWAAANGLVDGYGDGRFGPEDEVTREQLAAVLYRYCQFKAYVTAAPADVSDFSDAGQISGYAVEPVGWAAANGILSGREDGSLAPRSGATRAEAAAVLTRFHQDVVSPLELSPALPPEDGIQPPPREVQSPPAAEKSEDLESVPPLETVLPFVPTPETPNVPAVVRPPDPVETDPPPAVLEGVRILRNGQELEAGGAVRPGDALTAVAVPYGAVCNVVWTTREKRAEGTAYTVDTQDLGGDVLVSASGRDGYTGMAATHAAVTGELEGTFPQTEPETVSIPVDRGLGRVAVCLAGDETAAWAELSAGLSAAPEGEGFQLMLSARFDEAASAGDYRWLRVVLTPFRGEHFDSVPEGCCFDMASGAELEEVHIEEWEAGGYVMTWPRPEGPANLLLTLSINNREQMLEITFHNPEETGLWHETDSWEDAQGALAEGKDVRYTGKKDAVLSTSLELAESQRLAVPSAVLTVAADASLVIPVSTRADLDRLVVESGGRVEVDGTLTIRHGGQEAGGETLLSGTLQVDDAGMVNVLDALTVTGSGCIALSGLNSQLTVTGTFLNYGTLSAGPGSLALITGHSENHGLMSADGGIVTLSDKRRALLNTGKISVELRQLCLDPEYPDWLEDVGSLNILGTTLLNSGHISGTGAVSIERLDDLSGYRSGLVQPKTEEGSGPTGFVLDPAETVDVLRFPGELTNVENGVCELIRTELE